VGCEMYVVWGWVYIYIYIYIYHCAIVCTLCILMATLGLIWRKFIGKGWRRSKNIYILTQENVVNVKPCL
jgi:hypothetical protein